MKIAFQQKSIKTDRVRVKDIQILGSLYKSIAQLFLVDYSMKKTQFQFKIQHLRIYLMQAIDYRYLIPPNRILKTPTPIQNSFQYSYGKPIRTIFARTNYQKFQKQAIINLKNHLSKKSLEARYEDQLLLRFSYAGNFQMPEIVQKVKQYDKWHMNPSINSNNQAAMQILQNGHIYCYGRDKQCCPLIIVRMKLFDLKRYSLQQYYNAIACLLKPIEDYMLVPGIIQKWNVLVDFQGKYTKLSLQDLASSLQFIEQAYPFRLKRVFWFNSHASNIQLIQQLSSFLQKNSFTTQSIVADRSEIISYFNENQLEQRYGGYSQNLLQFWPIHIADSGQQTVYGPSEISQYLSVENNLQYFDQTRNSCQCGNKCTIY